MQVRMLTIGIILATALGTSSCARKSKSAGAQSPATPPARTEAQQAPTTPPPAAPETGSAVETVPVFFAYDSSTLSAESRAALDRMSRALRSRAEVALTIEGHCDERGTAEYNMALGERRAQAARDYLVASGVERSRIKIVSYGKERPFDEGHDESAWAQNRRAHSVVR